VLLPYRECSDSCRKVICVFRFLNQQTLNVDNSAYLSYMYTLLVWCLDCRLVHQFLTSVAGLQSVSEWVDHVWVSKLMVACLCSWKMHFLNYWTEFHQLEHWYILGQGWMVTMGSRFSGYCGGQRRTRQCLGVVASSSFLLRLIGFRKIWVFKKKPNWLGSLRGFYWVLGFIGFWDFFIWTSSWEACWVI